MAIKFTAMSKAVFSYLIQRLLLAYFSILKSQTCVPISCTNLFGKESKVGPRLPTSISAVAKHSWECHCLAFLSSSSSLPPTAAWDVPKHPPWGEKPPPEQCDVVIRVYGQDLTVYPNPFSGFRVEWLSLGLPCKRPRRRPSLGHRSAGGPWTTHLFWSPAHLSCCTDKMRKRRMVSPLWISVKEKSRA